jgi:hypothetical protein
MKDYLPGTVEFEESTLPKADKAAYRKMVRDRKGKCFHCEGKLDRFGIICQSCFGMITLPWVEREAMKAVNATRERELEDIYHGLHLV